METFLTRNDKVKNLKPRLSSLKNKLMKGKTQRNTKKIIQDHNEENTELQRRKYHKDHNEENQTRNGDRFETERLGSAGGLKEERQNTGNKK